MAVQAPPGLIGIHTNFPGTVPPEIDKLIWAGSPLPSDLSADEKLACDMLAFTYKNVQYAFYMALAAANAVRNRGFTGRPGRLATRPRSAQPRNDCAVL